jgi:AraC-like DNA-binding protein
VVEPLYFQDRPLGFIVCELGPHEGDVYELIRGNLSSALQGAHLFDEIQQARITAEKADRIKTRLLANVSHEMRTPLNIIIGYTQNALRGPYPPEMLADLRHIQSNAEHQLRVINDLLDLSRAEIDELDLALELLDPRPLLVEAFQSLSSQPTPPEITWKLDLPERLPLVRADAVRLRQIFLNLLSNARKFTERGQITLGAQVAPPHIHFWVSDTGLGIAPEQQERIFEPFVTIEHDRRIAGGIGLGLSITRHLVALHGGKMTLDSQPGRGSTFHIELPLPALDHARLSTLETVSPVLLLISSSEQPAPEIAAMCQRQGLEIRPLRNLDDLESALANAQPVALAWDLSSAHPGDWSLVRRLRHYPALNQTPFILYSEEAQTVGLTGFLVKSPDNQTLLDAINALCPAQSTSPVLIVDDDPQIRAAHQALVENGLPGCPIQTAENGEKALALMAEEVPALVLLDMVMPGLSGADVLDQMRADSRLRQVPVIILSNKMLTLEDVKRLENHARVTFQSKGVWSEAETAAAMNRALFGVDALPAHTGALVKRAVAYLHQNYARPLSRWEIAESVGVSEDYLTRVFNRELGLSPWDYLNRYRVLQAQVLLRNTSRSIADIARTVGFKDQAYFSRVFSKQVGQSPQTYRDA